MAKLYSPSTGGFYDTIIHGDEMPEDVVKITDEQWSDLLTAQAQGQVIAPGVGGMPQAVAPSATPAQKQAALVNAASAALTKSDVSVTRILAAGVAVPADFLSYRAALRAIKNGSDKTSTALPTEPTDFPAGT